MIKGFSIFFHYFTVFLQKETLVKKIIYLIDFSNGNLLMFESVTLRS